MQRSSIILTAIILFVLMFFFLFTPVSVVRFICLFFMGIIVFSLLHSILVARSLTIERSSETLYGMKSQPMTIKLTIKNRSPFIIPYLTVADNTGGLFTDSSTFLISLPPFGSKTLSYICKGYERGAYTVGPVNIRGADPLRLYPWKLERRAYAHSVVYPNIYTLELVNDKGLPAGNLPIDNKLYEDVTQFRSLRDYVAGDDMKRINWKASAKTGKLYTMEYDATLYFPVVIVLNLSREDYPRRQRDHLVERAIEVAASLTFYFIDLKQEVAFISTGTYDGKEGITSLPAKQGYEHAEEIIGTLALTKASPGTAGFQEIFYGSGLKIPVGVRIMVVSPRLKESQAEVVLGLHKKGLNLVLDDQE